MRRSDWEARLQAFIEANRDRPFEWGEWDCILMATACAAELTGVDKAADFRGQYTDKLSAAKVLREIGEGTLLRTISARFEPKPPGMAQRGDIVAVRASCGVCVGADGLFVSDEGLIPLPRADWTGAWTV